jgi:hypothetical protein
MSSSNNPSCVWLVAVFFTLLQSSAQPLLDQRHELPADPNMIAFGYGQFWHGQTFTAGVEGELIGINLAIRNLEIATARTGIIQWQLRSAPGGIPTDFTTPPLREGQQQITLQSGDSMAAFVLAPALPVEPGAQLGFFVLLPERPLEFALRAQVPGSYAGGSAFSLVPAQSAIWRANADAADYVFQTFVVPIPEPGILVMGSFAAIALILCRRPSVTPH